ncbi:uncharacterized protein LOC128158508 [Crassostrea angulata]|uniref:uncharacterized protein LOC128158508 n=1 Tax=Magallana angulata TaxID=2784310 RepID=UPI0022B0885A|nr:uncharacterized protein LOC128158508 [Crassostrea angulata]
MDGLKCSFGEHCKEKADYILQDCKKETSAHLRFFKCTSESDFAHIPEPLLILNRAGVHGLRLSKFSGRICAKHRQEFGIQWKRKRRTCCHPLHDKSQSGTVARGITFIQSREIWMKLSTHVPTGSGVCRRCIEKHKHCFKNNADMKEELKEICCLLERTTDSEAMDADGSFSHPREDQENERQLFVPEDSMEISDTDRRIDAPEITKSDSAPCSQTTDSG